MLTTDRVCIWVQHAEKELLRKHQEYSVVRNPGHVRGILLIFCDDDMDEE